MEKELKVACTATDFVSLDEIVPLQGDLKELNKVNFEKLKNSLIKYGVTFPIFLWVNNGIKYIVDGTQRDRVLKIMREDGWGIPKLPVDFIEAKDEQEAKEKILLLTSQYGKMTDESLYEFITTGNLQADSLKDLLALPQIDFEKFYRGYFENESPGAPEPQIDKADELQKKWKVKRGQIWEIGKHRLMCGNCTKIEDMKYLMNGRKSDMIFTDPPYNVDYDGMQNSKQWDKIAGDLMKPEKFEAFLYAAFLNMGIASKDSAAAYICHADKSHVQFRSAFEKAGYEWRATIIWAKNSPAFNFAQYKYKHEPIFYIYKKNRVVSWYGDQTQHTIWEADKEHGDHPTIKPVPLIIKAINNSSKSENIVADFFSGSGSTFVACEQTGRICYGMEIEPKYCAVILERMAAMGLKPKLTAIHIPPPKKRSKSR